MQLIIDHLWQSTLFALAAALLALGLRANAARVRYWVWFAASVKFLVPFAALGWIGRHLGLYLEPPTAAAPVAFVMDLVTAPAPPPGSSFTSAFVAVWLAGSVALLAVWIRRYWTLALTARRAAPAEIEAPVAVRFAQREVEPGLIGILCPVLLLPAGLFATLTSAEFRAILAHEVSHFHRRDNLTAAVHMLVQALVWFHPLVWWIGAKLVEEREHACDEAVLAAGNDAGTYAEAILKVCRFYVRSPLICAPGVSGADLKQRVEHIMMNRNVVNLSAAKKFVLGAAAVAAVGAPFAFGWAQAATREPASTPFSGLTRDKIAAIPQVAYDEFIAAVKRGEVATLMVIQADITGAYGNGDFFRTTAPADIWTAPQTLAVARANGVTIMVPPRTDPSRPNIGAREIYPPESKSAREEGVAVLRLTVDETGDVTDAELDQSTGYQRLDDAAIAAAVNNWHFMPGRIDGKSETMQMRIRVNFEMKE